MNTPALYEDSLTSEMEDEWETLFEMEDENSYPAPPSAAERQLVQAAIAAGTRNENSLSDLVFFRRHPERNGRLISRSESNYSALAAEWLNIRDALVRPLLSGNPPAAPVPGTTPPGTPPRAGTVQERILSEARRYLGFQEGPNNENPFSAYFGAPNVAWCAYFVSYVYTKAGVPLKIGSTSALLNHLRTNGTFLSNRTAPQPSDIVIFDWKVGDHTPAEHAGLVERVYQDSGGRTRVGTIEGNTSNGVNRRDYALGDARIVGFGRLVAVGSAPPAAPTPAPGGGSSPVNILLPGSGIGYYAYGADSKRYGVADTIRALQSLGQKWAAARPSGPLIGIGNISLKGGGRMEPHSTHQKGLNVDIRPLRTDGQQTGVTYRDAAYSRALTQELVNQIRSNGVLPVESILFNDSAVTGVKPWSGHDNHLHVTFRPPTTSGELESLFEDGVWLQEEGALPPADTCNRPEMERLVNACIEEAKQCVIGAHVTLGKALLACKGNPICNAKAAYTYYQALKKCRDAIMPCDTAAKTQTNCL